MVTRFVIGTLLGAHIGLLSMSCNGSPGKDFSEFNDRFAEYRKRGFGLALNNPALVDADDAHHMHTDDWVVGVFADPMDVPDPGPGVARAYPWWILRNYHVANDQIGRNRTPIFVALCEACSAASAFLAAPGGMALEFRHCGLSRGTYVVCDWPSKGRWNPLTGTALSGELQGMQLRRIQTYFVQWHEWKALHPDTTVLLGSLEQRRRIHGRGTTMAGPGMGDMIRATIEIEDTRLLATEMVFGLIPSHGANACAYRLESIRERNGLIQTEFDGEPVVIFLTGEYRVRAFSRRLADETLEFRLAADGRSMEDGSGTVFNEWGQVISGPRRRQSLRLVDGFLAKWFVWSNQFPGSDLE